MSTSTLSSDRLAFSPEEAAQILGISRDAFDKHVLRELRCVRVGRRVVIARKELERWLDRGSRVSLGGEMR